MVGVEKEARAGSNFGRVEPAESHDAQLAAEGLVGGGLEIGRLEVGFVDRIEVIWNPLDERLAPGPGRDLAAGILGIAVGADDKRVAARSDLGAEVAQDIGLVDIGGTAIGDGSFERFREGRACEGVRMG
jgi:hypothetical protein